MHDGKYFFLFPVLKLSFKWLKAIWKAIKVVTRTLLFLVSCVIAAMGFIPAVIGKVVLGAGIVACKFTFESLITDLIDFGDYLIEGSNVSVM